MASHITNPAILRYGWTAVPSDVELLLKQTEAGSAPAPPVKASDISIPASQLAKEVYAYAQKELPMRRSTTRCGSITMVDGDKSSVDYIEYRAKLKKDTGRAIVSHSFPSWKSPSFDETYFLSCLLHDIGTTDKNITATLMSFEFYGGLLALELLKTHSAPLEQAENVAEAVIRHQDLGTTGTLTRITALLQLATIFDNMGGNPQLVHVETIESVVAAWPRKGWSTCFASTIRKENSLKPWAHTTHLGERDFPEGVEGNKLMAPYDA